MIDKVIATITKELSIYLDVVAGLDVPAIDKIKISHLFDSTGDTIPAELGVTLVNIEEDRTNRAIDPYVKTDEGFAKVNPEIKLNLFVLFTANFKDNYSEALKFVSYVIQFFQAKNVFTTENTTELDPRVQKLIIELQPMSFEQQNYLWGMVGGKYLPSALYKFRMLVIQDNLALEAITATSKLRQNSGNN
jgi:hypothetical protein